MPSSVVSVASIYMKKKLYSHYTCSIHCENRRAKLKVGWTSSRESLQCVAKLCYLCDMINDGVRQEVTLQQDLGEDGRCLGTSYLSNKERVVPACI